MSKDLLASAIEDMERARGTIEALMGKPHAPDNGLPKTLAQQREEEPVAWTLRTPLDIQWGTVNYMTTFGNKEKAEEYARRFAYGDKIVVAPLYLHPPAAQPQEAEPVAVIGDAFSILWIGREPIATTIERNKLKIGDELYARPPKPAAQPQEAEPPPMQVTDGGRNELYEGLFDDETARERDDRLRRARSAQPQVPEEKDAHGPTLSTHRSYNAGWNDCRKAMLSSAKEES